MMPALFLKIVLSGFLYKRLMSSIFLPFIFFLSIVQLLPSRSSLFPLFYNFFAFLVELFLSAGLFHPIPFSSTLPDFLIYSSLLLYISIYLYLFTHCPPSISFLSFSLCGLEISVLSGCLTQLVARQQQQLVAQRSTVGKKQVLLRCQTDSVSTRRHVEWVSK